MSVTSHSMRGRRLFRCGFVLLGVLGMALAAEAQEIIAPRIEYSMVPPAISQYQTNQLQVFTPLGVYPHTPVEKPPLELGPVSVRPHVDYRFLYADGLPVAQTGHVASIVQGVSPGVFFGIGNHWTVDYTPTWTTYSSKDFRDTLDHDARLTWGTTYEDWTFGLSQSYVSSSEPLIETGTQTEEQTLLTGLTASYRFSSQLWTDLSVEQRIVTAKKTSNVEQQSSLDWLNHQIDLALQQRTGPPEFSDYGQWSTLDWLNYEFWQRLDAGVGVSFGYVDLATRPDMLFEGLQGRTRWRITDKWSLHLQGGVETRQFLGGTAPNVANPIAAATVQYQPFDVTRLSLDLDRTVSASYLQDQDLTETARVIGRLNQRLFASFTLDLSGGYSHIKYVASSQGFAGRVDDFYSLDAGISCRPLKRGTAAIFYRYTDNTSTDPQFSLTSNQVGFEIGYRF